MQTQFIKEGYTNYMILPWDGEWKPGYESNLFQFHEVPHFLTYEVRQLNGKVTLYYRLQYHTSLASVMDHLVFSYERVENMIASMAEGMRIPDEYLLNPDGILWDCSNIFIDVETGRLQFCYYPDSGSDRGDIRTVLTQILQKIDKKQDAIVLLLMRFYDIVTEDTLNVERLEHYRQKPEPGIPDFIERRLETEEREHTEKENPAGEKIQQESGKEVTNKEKTGIKQWIGRIIMSLLALADIVLFAGLITGQLSLYYMRYLFVGMILLIIVTICCMQKEEETPDDIMKDYLERMAQESGHASEATEEAGKYNKTGEEIGETSLLVEKEAHDIVEEHQPKEWMLKSMKDGKYPDIHLQKGNVVIGGMAEGCTYLLKERGVSRLHAKIMEKADGIYLLDLNSTNGTFLNGEMIEPGRDYKIEEGDMVAFANCEFVIVTSLLN